MSDVNCDPYEDLVDKLQPGIQALEDIELDLEWFGFSVSLHDIKRALQTCLKLEEEAKKLTEAGKDEVIEEQILTTDNNEFDPEKAKKVATRTLPTISKEQKEWTTNSDEKYVDYTPERFLDEADGKEFSYRKEFAEKMSFAVVWSLKKFFLSKGVLLSSHNCYKFFVEWLSKQAKTGKEGRVLLCGWNAAEWLHLYACGRWCGGDFGPYREDIKMFVTLLSEMEVEKEALDGMLEELKNDEDEPDVVVAVYEKKSVKFCGIDFTYHHVCK